ncbi:MAG: peptide-methionine (S)-S-oxide reductase MsrA [Chitinophagaceae bacterium]|jgi:peptide-methionine (S)-S-oxide reductase|nr:peptide-methionine (S)-S-oxide reductase MsrA [Chitinophagaceae bacterium]
MGNINFKTVTIGGGCFWCIESLFQNIKGVETTISGYAGGTTLDPTYREVASGRTGHAEVVQVVYDENQISYEELLTIFLTSHDPTTLNSQGADYGSQYRSIILFNDNEQKILAEKVIKDLNPVFGNKIVTEVKALDVFYKAEEYHQNYYIKNPYSGYCMAVINPKMKKLKEMYAKKVKTIL